MSKQNFLSLYLCRSAEQVAALANRTGIFVEDKQWDDNGYASLVEIYIKPDLDTEPLIMHAHMGILDDNRQGVGVVARLLGNNKEYVRYDPNDGVIYTLLRSSAAYRMLIEHYDLDRALTVLKTLNDVVFLKYIESPPEAIRTIVSQEVFKYSFIRNSTAWFAWNNAATILNGIRQEHFDAISPTMNIRFRRESFANDHNITLRFNFDALLSQRIAVIIGKNGIGKSQTLREIADALLEGKTKFSTNGKSARVMVNRLLAFSATQEMANTFPADTGDYNSYTIDYQHFSFNERSQSHEKNQVVMSILELARQDQKLGRTSRWDMFREALKSVDNSQEISLALSSDNSTIAIDQLKKISKPLPGRSILDILNDISETEIPFRLVNGQRHPLSSGEWRFLALAARLCRHIDNGTLVLIDEPETHLHPQFISQIADLLYTLLEMSGSVAIVATHSVYFVREVNHQQVIVLRHTPENEVHVDVPILRTLGANVGAISRFVFGQDQQTRQIERIKKTLLEQYRDKGWERLEADYGDVLASELLSVIRMEMEKDQ